MEYIENIYVEKNCLYVLIFFLNPDYTDIKPSLTFILHKYMEYIENKYVKKIVCMF